MKISNGLEECCKLPKLTVYIDLLKMRLCKQLGIGLITRVGAIQQLDLVPYNALVCYALATLRILIEGKFVLPCPAAARRSGNDADFNVCPPSCGETANRAYSAATTNGLLKTTTRRCQVA